MKKKLLGFAAIFIGFVVNLASAVSMIVNPERTTELDRIRERVFKNSPSQKAVLLMPRSPAKPKFSWLIAHGSHVSHASHGSHASHTSGTSSQNYTPNYNYSYTSPYSYATPVNPIKAHVLLNASLPRLVLSPEYGSTLVLSLIPGQNIQVIGYSGSWVQATVKLDTQIYTGWILETDIMKD
jgi:hypothetical protein